jgi:predicted NBD/HSP70 family sugar kinase
LTNLAESEIVPSVTRLGSLERLRENNRLQVIDALRRRGTASRADLSRETALSRTTVATIVADLQARGLVIEQSAAESQTESGGRGRPASLLRLDPSAGAAVGVDFGHNQLRVAVADLSSTVLAEQRIDLDVDHSAEAALDTAVDLIDVVLTEADLQPEGVIGVGVALSGPIDLTGLVGHTVILPSWIGINAATELSARLGGMHVAVENDANLGALAEVSTGAGRGLDDVIYVMVSSGIGTGLIVGGRLHRGAAGFAGEVGHVYFQSGGAVCRCGNRGCLETVASTDAMLELLRPTHGAGLTIGSLLELVADGDLAAIRVVGDAGRAIGRVLGGLANCLDPQAIIVGGDLSSAGEPLLTGIRESFDRYALPSAVRGVEIRPAVLGDRAQVLGALALVIGDTDRLRSAGLAALHGEIEAGVGT